jgi:hypothetical protein
MLYSAAQVTCANFQLPSACCPSARTNLARNVAGGVPGLEGPIEITPVVGHVIDDLCVPDIRHIFQHLGGRRFRKILLHRFAKRRPPPQWEPALAAALPRRHPRAQSTRRYSAPKWRPRQPGAAFRYLRERCGEGLRLRIDLSRTLPSSVHRPQSKCHTCTKL